MSESLYQDRIYTSYEELRDERGCFFSTDVPVTFCPLNESTLWSCLQEPRKYSTSEARCEGSKEEGRVFQNSEGKGSYPSHVTQCCDGQVEREGGSGGVAPEEFEVY